MNDRSEILKSINPLYFWDTDLHKLNIDTSKRLILERVFSLGSPEEMTLVIRYYGEKQVVETLQQVNYFDPKTLNFISLLFGLPKSAFKCYKCNCREWPAVKGFH
ncbi:MAG: DUF6922 domain-containing protein [Bacteroidales bacterium]